jgi:hypothetical protein
VVKSTDITIFNSSCGVKLRSPKPPPFWQGAKCVRGTAPARCCSLFSLRSDTHSYNTRRQKGLHSAQLVDPIVPSSGAALRRSVYGLIAYWNALPSDVIAADSVKVFQGMIQDAALDAIKKGCSISDMCALKFIHVRYGVEKLT